MTDITVGGFNRFGAPAPPSDWDDIESGARLQTPDPGPEKFASMESEGAAMNALRTSFLVAADVAVIALFVSLLAGCVTTPSSPSDRNGDVVAHMASVAPGR